MEQIYSYLSSVLGLSKEHSILLTGFLIGLIVMFLFRPKRSKDPSIKSTPRYSPSNPNDVTKISIDNSTVSMGVQSINFDSTQVAKINELIREDKKIEAIKYIRELTNLDLKNAKALQEALEMKLKMSGGSS